MINCLVIDDEPLAREGITDYIEKTDFLEFVGEGSSAVEIHKLSGKKAVDLIFLDIQMPILSGLEYLKNSSERPMVILTTAYPSYALEGFELDVLDYLVKPITFSRFYKSAQKAKDYFLLSNHEVSSSQEIESDSYFFLKCDNIYEKIYVADIEYVQAQQNYVVFHTSEGKYMTLMPLKRIWGILPSTMFIQVHKSFVVAIEKIKTLEKTRLQLTTATIPLSRNYKEEVFRIVMPQSVLRK